MELIGLVGAYVLGLGVSQIGLPPLIGYLGAGALLSLAGMDAAPSLQEIGHLGVLFLLFTVGLHLRVRNVLRAEVLGAGGIHLLASGTLFAALALAAGVAVRAAVPLGFLLALSSTVLGAKALEDRNALRAYHGRIAIGVLVLQDLAAVGVLAVAGMGGVTPAAALLGLVPLLRPLLLRILALTGDDALLLLYGLLLVLGGAALFGAVGFSDELGALAAGALLAGDARSRELADKLWGLKEAFLVGFFLEIGLSGFPDGRGWLVALGLWLLLPLKALFFLALFLLFRLRARTASLAALSLTSYSEFTLIAGATLAGAGWFPETWIVVLAVASAGSFVVGAVLNRYVDALYRRLENRLVPLERSGDHPDEQARSLGGARVLVVGMGRVGTAAYDTLAEREVRAVGLDNDPERIEQHLRAGRRVVYGDAGDPELWADLEPRQIERVILALRSGAASAQAAEALRDRGFAGTITALAQTEEEGERLERAGADTICHPLIQAGIELAESGLGLRAA